MAQGTSTPIKLFDTSPAIDDVMHNWERFNLRDLLIEHGEDLAREGLLDTPKRMHKAWEELLEGYYMKPEEILGTTFEADSAGLQVCQGMSFTSMCEHHLMPFFGHATIAYRANGRVVGLSKLSRLVSCFARRLQIQERMTQQIADALYNSIKPLGVLVLVKAQHFCCKGRGIKQELMNFTTESWAGDLPVEERRFWLDTINAI